MPDPEDIVVSNEETVRRLCKDAENHIQDILQTLDDRLKRAGFTVNAVNVDMRSFAYLSVDIPVIEYPI